MSWLRWRIRTVKALKPGIPFVLLGRLLQAAVVAAAIGLATWLQIHNEPDVPGWAIVAIAVVVGVFGPADSTVRTVSEWYGSFSFSFRLKVEDTLKTLLVSLSETTKIPWTEIGLTAFVIRHTRRHPLRGAQVRVARLRMKGTPRPTSVVWTKKKGLLGICWTQRSDIAMDHQAHYGHLGLITKKQWKELPGEQRMGLTWEDFIAIRDFGYVLASPILRSGRYRGCVVVQVLPEYQAELERPESLDLIHLTADTISRLL